jgi:hypothetical protein
MAEPLEMQLVDAPKGLLLDLFLEFKKAKCGSRARVGEADEYLMKINETSECAIPILHTMPCNGHTGKN